MSDTQTSKTFQIRWIIQYATQTGETLIHSHYVSWDDAADECIRLNALQQDGQYQVRAA